MSELYIPPMPVGLNWTSDQWKAIMARDKNILVAAAAGSGKTAVLVERMIQKILSEHDPLNVDELLVVTFTSAAAGEMRSRIGEALEKAIIADPHSRTLRKQLSLLNKAAISTLHSFCMDVIRKYYYLIDLDPGFRVADATEAILLQDEVMEELFESEYGKKDNADFLTLVDTFTSDRSDTELEGIVIKIYTMSRSTPSPELFLQTILDMYDVENVKEIDDLPFIKPLIDDIGMQLASAKEIIENALDLTRLPGGPAPMAATLESDLAIIQVLLTSAEDSWNTLFEAMQSYSFARAKTVRGEEYLPELKEEAKTFRDNAKKKINELKDQLFSRKPENFMRDLKEMQPVITTLVRLTQAFHEKFSALKREKGLVDYLDLEHYALEILTAEGGKQGEFLPSAAALAYRSQFKEVYIDEYQDVNMVQETILQLVSKSDKHSGNLFMVGDVKQAIYRFRLAEPDLFLQKYNQFTKEGSDNGLRIDLAQNFRSRSEVLTGTNFIFKQIMNEKVGEIEYDEAAELRESPGYPQQEPYPIELLLIDQTKSESESRENAPSIQEAEQADEEDEGVTYNAAELEAAQLEARAISAQIKKLMQKGAQVYDKKTGSERALMYRDIVILMRSMSQAPTMVEEFKQQGIGVYANISSGYFEATEVTIMLSLLKVIDNPAQDIPLASVLRSPIVALSEEEMALLRIYHKKGSYWDAVSAYCRDSRRSGEELSEKILPFFMNIDKWRSMARKGALSELIWQLYRDTNFYDFVGGLPGGKQRQANLRAFYDRARQYEETSFRGLFRFLRFIEKMTERGSDLGVARSLSEQEDVVRIMTIHSSKGLEFPVVFIAGLAKQFNLQDMKKKFLLDKEYGFAADYVNAEKRISYPSIAMLAFKKKKLMEQLAEEMRILYVALTRAKEKLYLVASVKNAGKQMQRWQTAGTNDEWLLKDYERASARSYLDWIVPALNRHRDFNHSKASERKVTLVEEEITNHPSSWRIVTTSSEEVQQLSEKIERTEDDYLERVRLQEKVPVSSPHHTEVVARFSWDYPYGDATNHRSKQSVSEIKRQREISDEYSGTDLLRPFKKAITSRPRFMQEKALSPAERGTALHLVMQHVDLTKPVNSESIKMLLERMVERELLTEEQVQVVSPQHIVGFFETSVGKRMLQAKKVQREVPFTLSLRAKEIYPAWEGSDEPVFIQGVIDCMFEDEEGFVLVDYKSDGITDRYKGGFEEAKSILADRYRVQLELYTKAIEQITRRKVTQKYLFFFDGANTLRMD